MPNTILSYTDIITIVKGLREAGNIQVGFIEQEYTNIQHSCQHNPILAHLLNRFPLYGFKKYYEDARRKFQINNPLYVARPENVHDSIFNDFRKQTREWLFRQTRAIFFENQEKAVLLEVLKRYLIIAFKVHIHRLPDDTQKTDWFVFLEWLISSYYYIGTSSPDTLVHALSYCLANHGETKEDLLTILFTSLDQARTAYSSDERSGNTYSCLLGVEERILDGFWPLCPEDLRIKDINTETMEHLVHLFILADGRSPSALFKALCAKALAQEGGSGDLLELLKEAYKEPYEVVFSFEHLELLNSIVPFNIIKDNLNEGDLNYFNRHKDKIIAQVRTSIHGLEQLILRNQLGGERGFYYYYRINTFCFEDLTKSIFFLLNAPVALDYFQNHQIPCQDSVMLKIIEAHDFFGMSEKAQERLMTWLICQNYLLSIKKLLKVQPQFIGKMLYLAAGYGHLEIVKFLLDQGADINGKIFKGYRLLDHAVSNGRLNIVCELLSRPSIRLVDPGNSLKFTPLHYAARFGRLEIVRKLLEQPGLKVNEISNKGTPMDIAMEWHHYEVARELANNKGVFQYAVKKALRYKIPSVFRLYKNIKFQESSENPAFQEGQNCAKHTICGNLNYLWSYRRMLGPKEDLRQWRIGYANAHIKSAYGLRSHD